MRTRIKICGVRDAATARAAVDAGADAIGVVFVRASPRFVEAAQAAEIVKALPPFVEPVGLFMDEAVPNLLGTARRAGVRVVQLHGQETPQLAAMLDGVRIVKAFPWSAGVVGGEVPRWLNLPALAGILWDAPPEQGGLPGGTGRTADWPAMAATRLHPGVPLILAGGLTPENVGEAVRTLRPYAVDVSSGVESSRGVKDAGLIRAFCDAVREADASVG